MSNNTPALAQDAVLTDEEIRSFWVEHGLDDEAVEDFARALESALLSKLRAPVADERITWIADYEPLYYFAQQHKVDYNALCKSVRAALASAPVAGEALKDECAATGQTCSYGPHGPHGERQCKYCGAAPQASEAECSCPSGDGSLRHPCAVHPAGDAVRTQALAALESARRFIRNGVEFGYIRMPDADTPDPAHRTPGLIEAAIRALSAQPGAQRTGGSDAD